MDILKLREAVRLLGSTNLSRRAIGRLVLLSHNTVSKYQHIMNEGGLSWSDITKLSDKELAETFGVKRLPRAIKRLPDWVLIHNEMKKKHQTLIELWEKYRSENSKDAYAYSQFCFHYQRYVSRLDLTMRQTHLAGECVFVDYAGTLIPWTDIETGKVYWAQIFVGVLGCSNYTFAWACRSQKIGCWIEAHNQMYAFFGGVPQVVVPDNLKSAVISPGAIPVINRTYLELSRHYDCVISPARVRKPQDKSKAELGVLLVSRWITVPLRRRKFFSINEINDAITELLPKLNQRPFKRLPGNRQSRFEALDQSMLKPLPAKPFEHAEWIAPQKVGPDYHVYLKGHAYSVPFRLVTEKVEARVTGKTVEIIYQNQRVASHVRNFEQGGCTTDPSHRPAKHQAYAEQTKENFLRWAEMLGPTVIKAVTAQFASKPEYSLVAQKACSQLKKLARIYGEERLEAACIRAEAINSLTVKSIRSILQRRLDEKRNEHELPIQTQLPLHANVRGPDYYQTGAH